MARKSESKGDARGRNRPLRGALVGYGFISSQGHVPGYLQSARERGDVEIVAVADMTEARRLAAQQALPSARIYPDHRSLLAQEAGNLDFIDISTPPTVHARIAHDALDRGLHVFCEKPLATTLEDARSMLAHASRARRVLFPCHNYKHAGVVKAIREILSSGAIGRVQTVTLSTYRNTHAKGVAEWLPHWRRDRMLSGGGIAMDHGPHTFYLAFEWLASYPTSISARTITVDSDRYDTEDSFTATLTFPTGVASSFLTWKAGVRKVIYTIHGDRGAITVDDDDMQISVVKPPNGDPTASTKWTTERRSISSNWMDASHVTWFRSLFDEFKAAIDADDFVGKDALEAYLAVQLITTAYRSAALGGRDLPLATEFRSTETARAELESVRSDAE
ncbi:MAG: Gfo/Idh/MocA family oxidoreductase [Deltaproteobacteria bacterium]|nr:Gfo/Idh/MocA family oxidoreductase [Deltaproteobacteria bacterium]